MHSEQGGKSRTGRATKQDAVRTCYHDRSAVQVALPFDPKPVLLSLLSSSSFFLYPSSFLFRCPANSPHRIPPFRIRVIRAIRGLHEAVGDHELHESHE